MNDDAEGGPRSARGPAVVWMPAHCDPFAARRVWRLTPLERADGFRRLSLEAIARSSDPVVRALAYLIHDALAAGEPERIIRDTGLIVAGGHHSLAEQADRRLRDAELRRLLRQEPYCGLPIRAAARAMLTDFEKYERRSWPRDRASGRLPQAGPTAVWASFLFREIRMPRSVNGLLAVFKRET